MKPFLTEYQYTKPMMPFMYDDLHQLLRDIVPKYIKPETLEKCKNASILCDVNLSDAKNHSRNKEVDIGFGAKWSSGQGARFPIQGSHVQNHWAAPSSTQPFILPRSIK